MRNALLAVASILLASCGGKAEASSSQTTEAPIVGTITEVRISSAVEQKTTGNDAVPGAIVGGILGGTTGAIIGSAAGNNSQTTVAGELLGCMLTVQMSDSTTLTFMVTKYSGYLIPCSLMRRGDRKVFTEYFRAGSTVSYGWSGQSYGSIWGTKVP